MLDQTKLIYKVQICRFTFSPKLKKPNPFYSYIIYAKVGKSSFTIHPFHDLLENKPLSHNS